jgi:hypothetical protein
VDCAGAMARHHRKGVGGKVGSKLNLQEVHGLYSNVRRLRLQSHNPTPSPYTSLSLYVEQKMHDNTLSLDPSLAHSYHHKASLIVNYFTPIVT